MTSAGPWGEVAEVLDVAFRAAAFGWRVTGVRVDDDGKVCVTAGGMEVRADSADGLICWAAFRAGGEIGWVGAAELASAAVALPARPCTPVVVPAAAARVTRSGVTGSVFLLLGLLGALGMLGALGVNVDSQTGRAVWTAVAAGLLAVTGAAVLNAAAVTSGGQRFAGPGELAAFARGALAVRRALRAERKLNRPEGRVAWMKAAGGGRCQETYRPDGVP